MNMSANNIIIRSWQETLPPLEMVERKGTGHPDTICDQLAEEVSVALCQYYMEHFGTILHHNVDKALLVGGISEPAFGGGEIIQPIEIYMAGRATVKVDNHIIPVEQLAISSIKKWFAENLRYLDVDNGIKINIKIRQGSSELTSLIGNGRKIPLANDTSFGTSAESGDDGQVGRGNRVNGLITPYRPMSLEAVSGKNPVNHVGKLYNLFANHLAQEIVKQKLTSSASVYVVSQIGKPVNEPLALDIVTAPNSDENLIKQLASDMLRELSEYALRK